MILPTRRDLGRQTAATVLAVLGCGAADAAVADPRPLLVVPEPAMLAMLGLGLIAVAIMSRRR